MLQRDIDRLRIEEELSIQAGELVARMLEAILPQYEEPDSPKTLHSLSVLLVRIVFCLYAEDANLFHKHQFSEYLQRHKQDAGSALRQLFATLDTRHEERGRYTEPELAAFPYANGGLFHGEVEIPIITPQIASIIYEQCGFSFDWSGISPTIFGALFESTLNPVTRRAGGMHYTSIGNILRVIDPLFLDGLRAELNVALSIAEPTNRVASLREFQSRISTLTFLDPACGSGNFLTETFIQLRDLENAVLSQLLADGEEDLEPKVSIRQLYGIEVNDFAVAVAKTALWIAQAQKLGESRRLQLSHESTLPLHDEAHIHHDNALRLDWSEVVRPEGLSYIMGNPPYSGARLMGDKQKGDLLHALGPDWQRAGNIDFVGGWFHLATHYMQGTPIRAAFIATNSTIQGEQATYLWRPLMERGLTIEFAYQPFRWTSESEDPAAVHIVIIGFSIGETTAPKVLYKASAKQSQEDGEEAAPLVAQRSEVGYINQYLRSSRWPFIMVSREPLSRETPVCIMGSQPNDRGLLLLSASEREEMLRAYPSAARWIRPFMNGEELINGIARYCLWLVDATPAQMRRIPPIHDRVKRLQEARAKRKTRHPAGELPSHTFASIRQPESEYLAVPKVSSGRREYVPMAFLEAGTVAGDMLFVVPEATLFHFGVLTSRLHMAWMRVVAGRLGMGYRYSNTLVYNNFPWPEPTKAQRTKIEKTAQAILDARALYPDSTLADLYETATMPIALRKAHQANDKAVLAAYGWDAKMKEEEVVERLMGLYRAMTEGNSE